MICLVQTASRSSLNGRHISKHCCHSGAMRVPIPFFMFSHICSPNFFLFLQDLLPPFGECPSADEGKGRVSGTVRQRCGPPLCWACWTLDPVPSQAAPVSSSNRVHYGSAPRTHRADSQLTQQLRVNGSLFASRQNHLLLNFLRQQMWPGGRVAPTAVGFLLFLRLSCLNFMLT